MKCLWLCVRQKKLQNEISIDESIGTDREGGNMTFSDILTCDSTDIADLISGKLEAQKNCTTQ